MAIASSVMCVVSGMAAAEGATEPSVVPAVPHEMAMLPTLADIMAEDRPLGDLWSLFMAAPDVQLQETLSDEQEALSDGN